MNTILKTTDKKKLYDDKRQPLVSFGKFSLFNPNPKKLVFGMFNNLNELNTAILNIQLFIIEFLYFKSEIIPLRYKENIKLLISEFINKSDLHSFDIFKKFVKFSESNNMYSQKYLKLIIEDLQFVKDEYRQFLINSVENFTKDLLLLMNLIQKDLENLLFDYLINLIYLERNIVSPTSELFKKQQFKKIVPFISFSNHPIRSIFNNNFDKLFFIDNSFLSFIKCFKIPISKSKFYLSTDEFKKSSILFIKVIKFNLIYFDIKQIPFIYFVDYINLLKIIHKYLQTNKENRVPLIDTSYLYFNFRLINAIIDKKFSIENNQKFKQIYENLKIKNPPPLPIPPTSKFPSLPNPPLPNPPLPILPLPNHPTRRTKKRDQRRSRHKKHTTRHPFSTKPPGLKEKKNTKKK